MIKAIVAGCLALGISLMTYAKQNEEPAPEGMGVETVASAYTAFEETEAEHAERMRWWREARFGLFIHWGVYAVPAGAYGEKTGYGEWIMYSEKIPLAEYRTYAERFNPVKYDPDAWVEVAKAAGMRYIVITAKHHDGFALYPSAVTTWDVADATPYGKDLLGPLVDAAKKEDLKIGFYYSQAQDWTHRGGGKNRMEEGGGWDEAQRGSFDDYLQTIALPQVNELFSQYPIDILWWDTPAWMTEERMKPFADAIPYERGVLVNDRLAKEFKGDFKTAEQFVPTSGYDGDWETCMTLNGHWGYNAADDNWKSSTELIRKLIEICSKGGNFLLNVGPTAEGEFPTACVERLKEVGRWLDVNGASIYGTTEGPFTYLSWGAATRKEDRLYLHVFEWPENGKLYVPLSSTVKGAAMLVDPDTPLSWHAETNRVVIELPAEAPDSVASVVLLDLAESPVVPPIASAGKQLRASSEAADHAVSFAHDGRSREYWEAADGEKTAWLEFDLGEPTRLHAFAVDEPDRWPRYRQQMRMEAETAEGWKEIAAFSTKGHGDRQRFDPIETQRVRLHIERESGPPGVAEWQLYSPE